MILFKTKLVKVQPYASFRWLSKDEYMMVVVHFDRSNYARLINGIAKIDKSFCEY